MVVQLSVPVTRKYVFKKPHLYILKVLCNAYIVQGNFCSNDTDDKWAEFSP